MLEVLLFIGAALVFLGMLATLYDGRLRRGTVVSMTVYHLFLIVIMILAALAL